MLPRFVLTALLVAVLSRSESISFSEHVQVTLPVVDKKYAKEIGPLFREGVKQLHQLDGERIGTFVPDQETIPPSTSAPKGRFWFVDLREGTFTQVVPSKRAYMDYRFENDAWKSGVATAKRLLSSKSVVWQEIQKEPTLKFSGTGKDRQGRRIDCELEVWTAPADSRWNEYGKHMHKLKTNYLVNGVGMLNNLTGGDTVLMDALDEYYTFLYTIEHPPSRTVFKINHPLPMILGKARTTFEIVTDFKYFEGPADSRLLTIPAGYKQTPDLY